MSGNETGNTRWWKSVAGKVHCELCPRACRLADGQRGFCFVRKNEGGKMILTTSRKSNGFCIDPIEKKPLNHFYPGTPVLSFGTAGCNLGCKFCQNWSISKSKKVETTAELAPADLIVKAAIESGSRSIAFTYNDPIIWAEYAIEVASQARKAGLKTVAVTSGYITEQARADFFQAFDAVNVDLKSFSETFYRKLTLGNLQPVLDTLLWLRHESSVWLEITNLIIPGENDSPHEIDKLSEWIFDNLGPDVPLHFSAFHPDYKMLSTPRTPHETLIRAREQAYIAGLNYVYVGNVLDIERQSTYCPKCGETLIERDHYQLGTYRITDGQCPSCRQSIPGYFENDCGTWGRKRQPIKLAVVENARQKNPSKGNIENQKIQDSSTELNESQLRAVEASVLEASQAVDELLKREITEATNKEPIMSDSHPTSTPPQAEFSQEEFAELVVFTRTLLRASILKEKVEAQLSKSLAESPAYGVFVTLKRGALLRACLGQWGNPEAKTLGTLLAEATISTAKRDPRFPSISPEELPVLDLEISLMHSPKQVLAEGEDRKKEIVIGTHGVVIENPQGRGILLPNVAIEHGWDIETLLQRLSLKAGLSVDSWSAEESSLMTFETKHILNPSQPDRIEFRQLDEETRMQLFDVANAFILKKDLQLKADSLLLKEIPELTGLIIKSETGLSASAFGKSSSLVKLLQQAANSLIQSAEVETKSKISDLIILTEAIPLCAADYPERTSATAHSAILARTAEKITLTLPEEGVAADKIGAALNSLSASHEDWVAQGMKLTAFTAIRVSTPVNHRQPLVRQPMAVGSFYPMNAEELTGELSRLFAPFKETEKSQYRAIMLPHAGWKYCGDIVAETVAMSKVPNLAIIICPKHTHHGAHWSVASEDFWLYPHAPIPIASRLAHVLEKRIEKITRDSEAHRIEHSAEAIIPFLHYANPQIVVLPIAIGNSELPELLSLGESLSEIASQLSLEPLFVISSDLNHFADDNENQRLDKLAIEAMESGDPENVYKVCKSSEISMCGMQAAVVVMSALLTKSTNIKPELVQYQTSAKTTEDYSKVVGYAGMVIK